MLSRLRSEKKGFTLIELIMVIVILGIVAAVAVPKFISLADTAKISAARGIGGGISGTIASKHADYLLNGNDYTLADVLSGTSLSGGVTYSATAAASPANGEISYSGTGIYLKYKNKSFQWTYTARSGDAPAYVTETSGF